MSRLEMTKIYHDHLEFVFLYKEHKILVRDRISHKEYELIPSGRHEYPFDIQVVRYLDENEK